VPGPELDSLEAKKVYAEPYEKDGITVIAAATVSGGPGAGTGRDDKGQEGESGGFGLTAKPTGTLVIADGEVRWEPPSSRRRRGHRTSVRPADQPA
jgi:uncharacterized spore protein YtfJ